MTSRLSVLECRVGPLRRGERASLERFDTFFARCDLLGVELSQAVVELATSLRASQGLRTPDARPPRCHDRSHDRRRRGFIGSHPSLGCWSGAMRWWASTTSAPTTTPP